MSNLLMCRPDLDGLPQLPICPEGYARRVAGSEEAAALATLLGRAFSDPEWTPERAHRDLFADATVRTVYAVEYGGALVATAAARYLPDDYPDAGYLHWVGVDPDHQGQRLGYLVSLAVLHDFARSGCHRAVLETQGFRLPAIKTYLRLGFRPVFRDEIHRERWQTVGAQIGPLPTDVPV